ncbi:MAG: sugar phosphate isomerase/epimerase [Spirochaetaceae bacterium]|nr:MAG: sugar phosphate isomerase/epimerase [Spirochaetaceae bacterium]
MNGRKKGFSSVWQNESQIDDLLPVIAASGFHGIEPTFLPGAIPSPEKYRRQAAALVRRCRDLGLQIPSLRGGRGFWDTIPSPDSRERAEAIEHGKRALECLALLGGKTLLVVPGRMRSDTPYEEHWKRVVDFARQAGEIAAGYGITIGLENVEARFPLSVRDWRDLLVEIDSPRVRFYFDVGNVFWLGLGYPEQWLVSLKSWICALHFKDAMFGKELRNLLAGDIDWRAVNRALGQINYQGWICVEPNWYQYAPQRLPARLSADLDAILALEYDSEKTTRNEDKQ